MKEIIYILFIIATISSNKVFSQEENSIYYITDLRGDISLEMEINNLESNNGPLLILTAVTLAAFSILPFASAFVLRINLR